MKRKLVSSLTAWRDKPVRKPLIVNGARQTGKTWLVSEFGKTAFGNLLYINFETNPRAASFFDDDISPARIVPLLEAGLGAKITPGETLLFFDEIQACERALVSLKYFCEQSPDIHIAAAGSLLGLAVNREKYSFPVGKVESVNLFPLDFEEFLWALGKEPLCAEIRGCFERDSKMPRGMHAELLELYRIYLVTGGMPEVVKNYAETGSLAECISLQNEIISDYIADMAKYAEPAETVKIRACFDSVPAQLSKENKKFQYKVVKSGGSAAYFGAAIDWLAFAGTVLKSKRICAASLPLAAYEEPGAFKIYLNDPGLLTAKSLFPHSILLSSLEIDNTFLGPLAENYVAAALAAKGYPLCYWSSGNQAEVDFVIQKDGLVVPVEVKAGIRVKSRSLSVFAEKYPTEYAIRISAKNFGFENRIKSVPLYAAYCI